MNCVSNCTKKKTIKNVIKNSINLIFFSIQILIKNQSHTIIHFFYKCEALINYSSSIEVYYAYLLRNSGTIIVS